ncbi:MAG: energy transducer TonB [Acidobacteria bacterium]|nr:energy transducer TonB [Acidobacteriota bacterium]
MRAPSGRSSIAIHAAAIALTFALRESPAIVSVPKLIAHHIDQRLAAPPVQKRSEEGGGGGADTRSASKGKLPRVAEIIIVPPTTRIVEIDPALPIEPAVFSAPNIQTQAAAFGSPTGMPGPPSDGPGGPGGIGDRGRNRVGKNGGAKAGVFSLSAVSTAPKLLYQIDPEYFDEARKVRFNGSVVLRIVIDEKGNTRDIEVVQSPGLGLDERAINAVKQWRFRPGKRDGAAVPVWATVEVNFRLL